ncbi:MAG: hypothetical protein Q8904_14230 [Bacteroidota bacterium]|nr:hypothetical protein [Bacteroidota bacterium]
MPGNEQYEKQYNCNVDSIKNKQENALKMVGSFFLPDDVTSFKYGELIEYTELYPTFSSTLPK